MPWNTPARGVADSSVSLDFGTPHAGWRGQPTFGMASSPEPSPVPFRTPASAMPRAGGAPPQTLETGGAANVSFEENDVVEDVGMEEEEDWADNDWLRGVAELYASTEATGPHSAQDLSEFVIRALDFHLGSCVEGGALPSAIARTWLLLHILFYDSAANLALWPLPALSEGGETRRSPPAQSWADIEKCLRPPATTAGEDGMEEDGGEFDPGLCHLRRILFWLEFAELGDPELDKWLGTWYDGVANCRQGAKGQDLTLKGCTSQLSVVDLSQLIWWHLRRGELAVAQARCRFGSGETSDRSAGAKQWWRAASLDASLFLFEPSQRAAMAGSQYAASHEQKYKDYKDQRLQQSLASATHARDLSSSAWLRHRRLCEVKATTSAQQAVQASGLVSAHGTQGSMVDKTPVLAPACDCAIHHALAGGNAPHVLNLGGVQPERLREVLRLVKVLRKWEDELWLDLRRIFTCQVARRFEGRAREDALGEVRQALRLCGDAAGEYEPEFGSVPYTQKLGEIQRMVMGVNLPGLARLLRVQAAVPGAEGGMEWLGMCAHLVIFFKSVLYLHRGGTVQRQGVGWQEGLAEMLRAGDEVLRAYVLELIGRRQWGDIPRLLRVMQNHFVPGEEGAGAAAFNEVLGKVAQENARSVQQLSVQLLAEVEAREPSADVRREVMVQFQQAMGVEALKATGKEVAGKLEDHTAQELGVRLQEIFQQTGQWDQAVHQAHAFLRQFVEGGRGGETGAVVSMLLGLVRETVGEEEGQPVLGIADFAAVWQSAFQAAGEGEGAEELRRVLERVRAKKKEADALLWEFMEVWEQWQALDAKGRRGMLHQQGVEANGQPTPSLFEAMAECVPGASRGAGGVREVVERDGVVRAARGYVEGLWEVRQLAGRLGGVGEVLERLAYMLQQLARLSIWGGIAQAVDAEAGGVRVWQQAFGSTVPMSQQGSNEVATSAAVLEGGAVQSLYKTLVVLQLRPVWVALDEAEGATQRDGFRELMAPTLESLLVGDGGYLDVCRDAGAGLAHFRGPQAEEEWHSLALGLASVVADDRAGVYLDLSDECIEKMISGPWARSALSLWCSGS